jgi:histidinol-phosphate aminotransferase
MSLIRPTIRSMAGYTPGEQVNRPDVVKLNMNESPFPQSPRVIESIRSCSAARPKPDKVPVTSKGKN